MTFAPAAASLDGLSSLDIALRRSTSSEILTETLFSFNLMAVLFNDCCSLETVPCFLCSWIFITPIALSTALLKVPKCLLKKVSRQIGRIGFFLVALLCRLKTFIRDHLSGKKTGQLINTWAGVICQWCVWKAWVSIKLWLQDGCSEEKWTETRCWKKIFKKRDSGRQKSVFTKNLQNLRTPPPTDRLEAFISRCRCEKRSTRSWTR